MDSFTQYPFLDDLLSTMWLRHRKTLALVIDAIAVTGQARSFAIATTMARRLRTRLDSAVNRFYRLLRNPRVDYVELATRWAQMLARPHQGKLVLAVDWTEWHHDIRMLVAAVVTGKRAIPLWTQATKKIPKARSQNSYENSFLRLLADILKRAGVDAVLLFDRGFRRVSWIELLQRLRLGFVVRLMDDVSVEIDGQLVTLSKLELVRGKVKDLGVVPLRSDGAVRVRVIGYLAKNAKEAWWIATSETGHPNAALKLYDRRMTVEEQFRDLKGRRFGAKLFWTQFRDPEALARFMALLAIALLIWMTVGVAASRRDKSLRLVSRRKGPRQSYVTIGSRILALDLGDDPLTVRNLFYRFEPPQLRVLGRNGFGAAK